MPPASTRFVALLACMLSGCVSTRLVEFDNLDVPLPAPAPQGWRADMSALFDRYESAPVLSPEDERLEPLFGGVTTLSYFGADAKPRVVDQQIPPAWQVSGQSLAESCDAPPVDRSPQELAMSGLPAFSPLWIPLAIGGGAAADGANCDAQGKPSGEHSDTTFCVFARLALQPVEGRSLIVVVHGMFDSGAQEYVQRMAAVLYRLGHSVLLPDMRDHGDTFRAAPTIATTLGTREGPDLLAIVDSARRACRARIGRVGIAGVSGGGLDAIRAFTLDRSHSLDADVIAISPLIDVNAAISDAVPAGACPITQTIELGLADDLSVAAASGGAFFGGAALTRALSGQRLDGRTAIVGGIGAAAGLLTMLAIDAFFDGGSRPCVSENAIAQILQDVTRIRWRTLRNPEFGVTMSPAGALIATEAVTLQDYVRERAQFLAARSGVQMRRFDARLLSNELRVALASGARPEARLLVLGAQDDPMTRFPAFRSFIADTHGISQLYVRAVQHGGHGAMWIVQSTVMAAVFARFFGREAGGDETARRP